MISAPEILDYVIRILKAADRPLVAREICNQLLNRGVILEKTELNQILWTQNDRPELIVDKNTFKWRYDPDVARQAEEAEKRKEETRREVSKNASFLEFWENIGFEFVGVKRKNTDRPFFFLREEHGQYVLVGPAGNVIRERSVLCSEPDSLLPSDFTLDQVKTAADEILKQRRRQAIDHAHETIAFLRDTELLRDDVYLGPIASRVEDAIPVAEIIFVGHVSPLEPCHLTLGWGTVLAPLYLVINILGIGVKSDTRYGVFKICAYELIKRNLVVESEGDLILTLSLEADRVYIGHEDNNRSPL